MTFIQELEAVLTSLDQSVKDAIAADTDSRPLMAAAIKQIAFMFADRIDELEKFRSDYVRDRTVPRALLKDDCDWVGPLR